MTARKRSGSGRTTPKGTKNPTRSRDRAADGDPGPGKERRPAANGRVGKVGRQPVRASRPISHNRGNR